MSVVTRFAPSPTGFLHLGGARTALFNWLYARHHGGRFVLRIEDTDRARSTQEAVDKILDGLTWLGLTWDGEAISQASRIDHHKAAVERLLAQGKAYYCYCTPEELAAMRDEARSAGKPVRYDGRWRDRDPAEAPSDVDPVVRLKAPLDGMTVIDDRIQGRVEVANGQLDDMVLLRGDGTPTYMLSVVVDDIDMGITHVIRGDDHLTNAFRQTLLYRALGADTPEFAHIPLIHGADGAKLSKRHGSVGIEWYREQGFLPEAMCNYLLRLGWSHGDDEIISSQQAVDWFDLEAVGKSPSRFDIEKLDSVNSHYLRSADDDALLSQLVPHIESLVGHQAGPAELERLRAGLDGLRPRAKRLTDLAENAAFFFRMRPLDLEEGAVRLVDDAPEGLFAEVAGVLAALPDWTVTEIENSMRSLAESQNLKLGKLAQPMRAALTGTKTSPGIFDVIYALGREETLGRLADAAEASASRVGTKSVA